MNEIGNSSTEMSSELKDTRELKSPETENFKNIKPEEGMTAKEAKSFWKEEFSKEQEKTSGKDAEFKESKVESGLTSEEKLKIKEETGWSDAIVDYIDSMEQYKIYKEADLHEAVINGRECLIKNLDLDYVDPKTGMTNSERIEKGLSPLDAKTGERITLHHMKQEFDGPFAELCENSEHGDGNNAVLHPKQTESWRNDPEKRYEYRKQKDAHWDTRAKEMQ